MNKDIKKKNIILSIVVLLIGLFVVGGTYAWLTATMEVTDGNYAIGSDCFLVDYDINNGDNTQNITGTMFPSFIASKGLNGRVGLKINNSCNMYGTGTIKLHVDSSVDSKLTTGISSYCESKKTLEKIDGINTKEACDNANGNWMGYSDSYCENPNTLERIKEYTNQSDCESNNGSWTSGGSPLKYAVYNTSDATQIPISVGHITSSDIGHDVVLKENIIVTDSQEYYYIYIWLDGNMTDNTFANISFSGTIIANAIQNNDAKNDSITLTFDYNGATGGNTLTSKTVVLGEPYGTLPTPTRTGYTFMGWSKNGLTSEYQEVEYIESNGTQWIDTMYYLTSNNIDIKTKIYVSSMPSSEQDIISNQDGFTGRFVIGLYQNKIFSYSRNQNGTDTNVCSPIYNGSNTFEIETIYNYTNNLKTMIINEATYTETQNATISNNNQTIKIFKAGNTNNMYFIGRIYYLQIYENNNLVRNLIPSYRKIEREIGMYDTINNVFYTNKGTGTFLKGEDTGVVSSSTIVDNPNDHTLYAILEPNS